MVYFSRELCGFPFDLLVPSPSYLKLQIRTEKESGKANKISKLPQDTDCVQYGKGKLNELNSV